MSSDTPWLRRSLFVSHRLLWLLLVSCFVEEPCAAKCLPNIRQIPLSERTTLPFLPTPPQHNPKNPSVLIPKSVRKFLVQKAGHRCQPRDFPSAQGDITVMLSLRRVSFRLLVDGCPGRLAAQPSSRYHFSQRALVATSGAPTSTSRPSWSKWEIRGRETESCSGGGSQQQRQPS